MRHRTAIVGLALLAQASAAVSAQSTSWLDRPMVKWHSASASIPSPPATSEPVPTVAKRCAAVVASGSGVDVLLEKAGWIPFLHVDRRLTRDDVEVVGGMVAASPACEPTMFNLFVFVGGRFAGTLSPSSMQTARDGVAGSVRLTGQDALTSEFARYTAADAECCPSSIVRVTYRIDRQGTVPVLKAVEGKRVR